MAVQKSILVFVGFLLFTQVALGQRLRMAEGADVNRDSIAAMRNKKSLLDTTVEKKYGASSTRFTYEANFKYNDIVFYSPDTLPENLHRFDDLAKNDYLIQNLGNIGTAMRQLFYNPSANSGITSGYYVYDQFYTTPDQIRYYDTRSPFTKIETDFGGGNRNRTDIIFTFNDSINFNIGANYKITRSDKQLAYLERGDRQIESTNWNVFGFLRPKKLPKYLLLFNTTHFVHKAAEQGGIFINPEDEEDGYFKYEEQNVILDEARSYDKRGNIHIYQQYGLDSIFEVYHSATFEEQIVRYYDEYDLSTRDSLMYHRGVSNIEREIDTLQERSTFTELMNEVGFKGRTKTFSYTLYYKNRLLSYNQARNGATRDVTENYFGGTLRQNITKKILLKASGELGLDGNYSLVGDFSSSLFSAEYKRVNRRPNFLMTSYAGQQENWIKRFDNEVSDNIYAEFRFEMGALRLEPFLRFNRIANYMYFDENRRPDQAGSDIVITSPGATIGLQISKKWAFYTTSYFTQVTGGSAEKYRVPKFMNTSQLAYRNMLFDGKMMIHTGLESHFRSSYVPYAYDPTIQQFYLQNDFSHDSFVKLDAFLNFKVKNLSIFAKVSHFNQLEEKGYFITPDFTGTRFTVDLGARWYFFD